MHPSLSPSALAARGRGRTRPCYPKGTFCTRAPHLWPLTLCAVVAPSDTDSCPVPGGGGGGGERTLRCDIEWGIGTSGRSGRWPGAYKMSPRLPKRRKPWFKVSRSRREPAPVAVALGAFCPWPVRPHPRGDFLCEGVCEIGSNLGMRANRVGYPGRPVSRLLKDVCLVAITQYFLHPPFTSTGVLGRCD